MQPLTKRIRPDFTPGQKREKRYEWRLPPVSVPSSSMAAGEPRPAREQRRGVPGTGCILAATARADRINPENP